VSTRITSGNFPALTSSRWLVDILQPRCMYAQV